MLFDEFSKEQVLAEVRKNGLELRNARLSYYDNSIARGSFRDKNYAEDEDIVLAAVMQNPEAIAYVSETLRQAPAVQKALVSHQGYRVNTLTASKNISELPATFNALLLEAATFSFDYKEAFLSASMALLSSAILMAHSISSLLASSIALSVGASSYLLSTTFFNAPNNEMLEKEESYYCCI